MSFVFENKELVFNVIATALAAWISVKMSIARLEVKVDTLIKDVDGIAEFVGTPRAIARIKQKKRGK